MSTFSTDLREDRSARTSCDDTDLQCTGRNQPICSSRAVPSASGNWRVTFRFEDGSAVDVDYVDYH